MLLKGYECSLHINPSFQFLSSIRPKSRSLYTLLPPTRTVHTYYGGGGRANCQQSARTREFSAFVHIVVRLVWPAQLASLGCCFLNLSWALLTHLKQLYLNMYGRGGTFIVRLYNIYIYLLSSFNFILHKKQYLQQSKSFYLSDYFLFKIIQVKFNFINILFWVGMISFIFYLLNIFNWLLSLIYFAKIAEEIFVSAILFSLFSLSFLSFCPKHIYMKKKKEGGGWEFLVTYERGLVNNFQYISLFLSLKLKGYSRNICINHNSFLQVKYVDVVLY